MAIAESGGPTTQSGILYQNGIAALYIGKMLDSRRGKTSKKIVEVRVEAPEHVDDIVITYANGTKRYIQVKESVKKSNKIDSPWGKMWTDFEAQFNSSSFSKGRDKLILYCGLHKDEIVLTQHLAKRACSCKSFEEWQGRLNGADVALLDHLRAFLSTELNNNNDLLLLFFSSIDVSIYTREVVEADLILLRMPESNHTASVLFSLLRDRVGDVARIRGTHTSENLKDWLGENNILISEPVSHAELRSSIYSCSSILRYQKNTLGKTGITVSREIHKDISEWLLKTTDENPLGVLLDLAGTGKSVLLQEILMEMQNQEVNVLAIKADQQLSGVKSMEDIQTKLDLPFRVERLVSNLSVSKPFVVLIDQIDALSLSIAHDQQALNMTLDLISRLRSIPNVRILISCRKFDFESDPRLKNIENNKVFSIGEFSENEVKVALGKVGLEYTLLLPSTQKLLKIPLHLNLFLMAYETVEDKLVLQDRGLSSLQELYQLLWEQVIMKQQSDSPRSWEREQVLTHMAQYMDREQKITMPKSFFTQRETNELEGALNWLLSEGIIFSEGNLLSFFHQTFFDYCYARDFNQQGCSLVDTLIASPQGLFQRPQLVQVLSYLRGQQNQRPYLLQLNELLKTDNLRYHLKNHLYRWFASISNPTEQEWRLLKRMSVDLSIRSQLLQFSYGNPGWFDYWRVDVLSELLDSNEEDKEIEAFHYLCSMVNIRQEEVMKFLHPYYTKCQHLEKIVCDIILQIRVWKSPEAVKFLETVIMKKIELDNNYSYFGWEELVHYDPKAVCRIIRNFMFGALEAYKKKRHERKQAQSSTHEFSFISLKGEMNKLVSTTLEEAFQVVVNKEALYFLDSFIPWLNEAVKVDYYDRPVFNETFISDSLFRHWYDRVLVEFDSVLQDVCVKALLKVAHDAPQAFIERIESLSEMPYESIQFLVAHILRQVPGQYLALSLQFLLGDPRRLSIGHEDFESRHLIIAIVPYLKESECRALENFILTRLPIIKEWKRDGYRFHDRSQLGLLEAMSWEKLSSKGKKRFQELGRKFPDYSINDNPRRMRSGAIGSPINRESARKMTDLQWMRAMSKYQGKVRHSEWLKGGAGSLSSVLQEFVKEEPQRFFELFNLIEIDLDQHYVIAFINGFAESSSSSNLLFQAIVRFEDHNDRNVQRTIAWAVQKHTNQNVPSLTIKLMNKYLYDETLTETEYIKKPSSAYLNTVRGSAMYALMKIYKDQECEKWGILNYAARSSDISLRAGAIEELPYMIRYDRERTIDLFEQTVDGYTQLYQMSDTHEFVYWAMGKPFERLIPFLNGFLVEENEDSQQRGAELVALSYISNDLFESQLINKQMEKLLKQVIVGNVAHRRGVARIFSYNVLDDSPDEFLINGLYKFMNDEDEEVRRQATFFLYDIKKKNRNLSKTLRDLILVLVQSKSVTHIGYQLGKIIWESALDYPEWALTVIKKLLMNEHVRNKEERGIMNIKDLVYAVLNIYTDPLSDEELQNRAMDTFDNLMELYSMQAQSVLAEWDRH
ncbi:hypothetical protein NST33_24960 [Paenibacillus sp. FSL L8-0435]|uniref:hypothetical protein n=1 Tax=Paenibacillus sp. FSL L8-0435 TaxID=2954618 RepID=UPI0030DBA18D